MILTPVKNTTSRRIDGVEIDPAKLVYFRQLRNLTRDQLSARSGVPVKVLQYYERGSRRPRARAFRRLYTALGIGPEDLLKYGYGKAHLRDTTGTDSDT